MNSFKTKAGTEFPLMDFKGKKYLQVAYRLVWFREEHHDWGIETDVKIEENSATSRCIIRNHTGQIIATAHKFEDRKGFSDFIEKSETGSIGRALAMCGYGTQFTLDLDEGERLADAPLTPAPHRPAPPREPNGAPQTPLPSEGTFGIYCTRCEYDFHKRIYLRPTKKDPNFWNCPNFQDKSKGPHDYIHVNDIPAIKEKQKEEMSDVPF